MVRNLTYRYGALAALTGISLEVPAGQVVAVVGPSGAGKTTLFRSIAGLSQPEGEVTVNGRPEPNHEVAMIFQQYNLVRRLDALHNVLGGRLAQTPTWRVLIRRPTAPDRHRALADLERVGLGAVAHQRVDRLSGGQQQRVAIARALAQESSLILADEPVASLDPRNAGEVLTLLRTVTQERGITVLASLHQIDLALEFADRVIGLRDGRLVVDCATTAWNNDAYHEIFGRPTD